MLVPELADLFVMLGNSLSVIQDSSVLETKSDALFEAGLGRTVEEKKPYPDHVEKEAYCVENLVGHLPLLGVHRSEKEPDGGSIRALNGAARRGECSSQSVTNDTGGRPKIPARRK